MLSKNSLQAFANNGVIIYDTNSNHGAPNDMCECAVIALPGSARDKDESLSRIELESHVESAS